ncbi:MAG: FixH family protein [Alphaproteobacteria bacterium]|nr:FixH family protein [Alphaproteobacteria bacterium]
MIGFSPSSSSPMRSSSIWHGSPSPALSPRRLYEDGLAYNDAIAASREQAARDWSVSGEIERAGAEAARVAVLAKDADGASCPALTVTATLRRPASPEAPVVVVLPKAKPALSGDGQRLGGGQLDPRSRGAGRTRGRSLQVAQSRLPIAVRGAGPCGRCDHDRA